MVVAGVAAAGEGGVGGVGGIAVGAWAELLAFLDMVSAGGLRNGRERCGRRLRQRWENAGEHSNVVSKTPVPT